jgi:hypothetical protein
MDLEYINLLIALLALISSFASHLRHSKCCFGLVELDMKEDIISNDNSPNTIHKIINESSV